MLSKRQRGKFRTKRRGKGSRKAGPAFNPDIPAAGCYRIRLKKGGPFAALRIWLGPPLDPDTGEEMENRPWRWQARLNGAELVPPANFWPGCARDSITEEEHNRLCALSATMDPAHPFYDPLRKVDRLKSPVPF